MLTDIEQTVPPQEADDEAKGNAVEQPSSQTTTTSPPGTVGDSLNKTSMTMPPLELPPKQRRSSLAVENTALSKQYEEEKRQPSSPPAGTPGNSPRFPPQSPHPDVSPLKNSDSSRSVVVRPRTRRSPSLSLKENMSPQARPQAVPPHPSDFTDGTGSTVFRLPGLRGRNESEAMDARMGLSEAGSEIGETGLGMQEVVVMTGMSRRARDELIEVEEEKRAKEKRIMCRKPKPGTYAYQAYLAYLTMGIVYGDIGTSPLYVFSSIFPSDGVTNVPAEIEIMGALSLILWTMIMITVLKYICLVLLADDNGEGGTFALYTVLSRAFRKRVKDSKKFNRINEVLALTAVFGISAILSDGVLTPAISVLGAVQGLTLISSSITSSVVIGVSCAILFCFFMVQRFGTSRVSLIFSPIILLWFLSLFSIGVYNITMYPAVLAAFSPWYAFNFFIRKGFAGYADLGAVILCVTGSEAMFAGLGHFNRLTIRLSSLLVVIPSLMVCYCGQAAALIVNPAAIRNTFYETLPPGLFYPMLVLATLAAIIASQAMVSASFSIIGQAIRLQLLPRMSIVHTSEHEYGQIYIRETNYFFMIATIIIVICFQNATALGYAYGIAVCFDMFITTAFYSLCIVVYFKRHWIFAVCFFLVWALIDVSYMGANLLKFTTGGWFTVMLTLVFTTIQALWRWGRLLMVQNQLQMAKSDEELVVKTSPKAARDEELTRSQSRTVVFVNVQAVNVAFVDLEVRLKKATGDNTNVYHALVYHGYCDKPPSARDISMEVIRMVDCFPPDHNEFGFFGDDEMMTIVQPVYVTGRDHVITRTIEGRVWSFIHTKLVEAFNFLLFLSKSPVNELQVPPDMALEVGVVVQI